ncbi:Gfo/Idh/MocA family oxidoreductase [Sphingomonas sp.]|uniref:Gfo/Idh/MocA family oxidoreductase n=1 Tax=Sphingomonas sp. TaxID=28214 RepID=UPI0031E1FA14
MNVAIAGTGAFAEKHLAAIDRIRGATLAAIVGPEAKQVDALAQRHGAIHADHDLARTLERQDVDAVILATPTPLHAEQALACLDAGKHVMVEIPLADGLAQAEAVLRRQRETGRVAMVGHTRRFNPSHRHLHRLFASGAARIQQLDVQTHFLRRTNTNAKGEPRSWTDHLLWHHAAHTVDLFAWQAGPIVTAHAMSGPVDPHLGIAMDMSIQLKAESGALCTLSLSFNNDGPLGSFFRYICDTGTWIARYDELVTGAGDPVALAPVDGAMDGVEAQDREFLNAIRDGRQPIASVAEVMPCYRTLAEIETMLSG